MQCMDCGAMFVTACHWCGRCQTCVAAAMTKGTIHWCVCYPPTLEELERRETHADLGRDPGSTTSS